MHAVFGRQLRHRALAFTDPSAIPPPSLFWGELSPRSAEMVSSRKTPGPLAYGEPDRPISRDLRRVFPQWVEGKHRCLGGQPRLFYE